jgi:hypothetical protein
MQRYLRRSSWRPFRHRLYAGVTLLAHLATMFGLPMPAPAAKANSEPFPCQHHACGCQTAEQCWRHCCCFTPEQRWAWAREHQVQPPSYAEKPTGQSWRSPRKRDQAESQTETRLPPCCARAQEKQKQAPARDARGTSGLSWKMAIMAQSCRGLTSHWAASGAALPAMPPISWAPYLPPAEWITAFRVVPDSVFRTLLDPPPKTV